jgi:hypothetical protein
MISLHWVMVMPQNMTPARFDDWYLFTHTRYGKASLGIIRYAVNRVLETETAPATGAVYRVAQEYWNNWEALEACWNSPSGHAVLGDGLVNIGLDPSTIPGVALTTDRQFEVAQPANFSTFSRGYRHREDGTIIKFMAFGCNREEGDVGAWYRERFSSLGQDLAVREHIFGTSVGKKVQIGYLSTLPGPTQIAYDWVLELWFDDVPAAKNFLHSESFAPMWSALTGRSHHIVAALFRGQEMLVSIDPVAHRED